jgi:hypothetical protein
MAVSDSSYVRVSFPFRKLNTWTAREGSARQAKWDEEGENVSEVGIVFVFLK